MSNMPLQKIQYRYQGLYLFEARPFPKPPKPLVLFEIFSTKFGILNPPSPLEFSVTFLGKVIDLFWNYTIYIQTRGTNVSYLQYESIRATSKVMIHWRLWTLKAEGFIFGLSHRKGLAEEYSFHVHVNLKYLVMIVSCAPFHTPQAIYSAPQPPPC